MAHRLLIWILVGGLSLLVTESSAQPLNNNCPNTQPSRLVVNEQARVIALDGINLRQLPNLGAELVDVITRGEFVDVLEGPLCVQNLAWYRIASGEERGWTAEGLRDVYFLEPYIIQHAQVDTIELSARPELVDGISTAELDGRIEFLLEGYPVFDGFFPPIVRVFDGLPDFAEVALVRNVLNTRNTDWIDAPAVSNLALLALPDGEAVRYTSLFVSMGGADVEPVLLYSARGITQDGRYISLNLPIRTEALPRPFRPQGQGEGYLEGYLQEHQDILNNLPPGFFEPNLDLLDEMLQTLTVTAVPLPTEDLIPFVYFDSFRIDYPPSLARTVDAQSVEATPELARHIGVTFNGYPVRSPFYDPVVRVFSADFLPQNWFIGLALQLEQGVDKVTEIPIPSLEGLAQPVLAQVRERSFRNGEGVRFVAAYAGPDNLLTPQDLVFSFQGITEDGRFYLSLLLPVALHDSSGWPQDLSAQAITEFLNAQAADAFVPSLHVLDGLVQSLQMRVPGN